MYAVPVPVSTARRHKLRSIGDVTSGRTAGIQRGEGSVTVGWDKAEVEEGYRA